MSVEAASDWRDHLVSAEEAVSVVRPGDKVFVGSACATPPKLGGGAGTTWPTGGWSWSNLSPAPGLAEVAYMVDPEWQGAGVGGLLHARTFEYAQARGVRGFRADVLVGNTRTMRVFRRAGHQPSVKMSAGIEEVTMLFPVSMPERLPAVGGPDGPAVGAVGGPALADCDGMRRKEDTKWMQVAWRDRGEAHAGERPR